MQLGSYDLASIDFAKYSSPLFYPKRSSDRVHGGCGNDAFFTLTGKNLPLAIRENKTVRGVPRPVMVRQLKRVGLTVMPVTGCQVVGPYINNNIRNSHVLLFSQLFFKNEASWTVLHQGKMYHAGCVDDAHYLEFLNRPIIATYLIWHKSWALPKSFVKEYGLD